MPRTFGLRASMTRRSAFENDMERKVDPAQASIAPHLEHHTT